MRLPLLLNLSLAFFALGNASAQLLAPADAYFNSGAQFYISNSIPQALETVERGLKFYPNNEKLKKLEELLKQQQQQQNQKQDQQQKQDQKDQQSQSDQQKQEKQDQQQKQQGQQGKQDEQKPEQKEGEPQQVQAGQMTPQEAQKLLDAQKSEEKVLRFKPDGKPKDMNRPIKDW